MILDAQRNVRYSDRKDFGWKLYIENPLADDEAPIYEKNSLRLSLSEAKTDAGRAYQILTARWRLLDKDIKSVYAFISDDGTERYSWQSQGKYDPETQSATATFRVPDYAPSGTYKVNRISMFDVALNRSSVYFTDSEDDEPPVTIEVQTTNPDSLPPVLDVNRITIEASPTHIEAPNGETQVDITFRAKDDISGYAHADMLLRDPQGNIFHFQHSDKEWERLYSSRDPTVYETYHKTIILPVGSPPGVWGLAEMSVRDKANNRQRYDFTEIVRFEVNDTPIYARSDVNQDGSVNIQDLVLVANQIGLPGTADAELNADINADGVVDIIDLVQVANAIGAASASAPAIHSSTAEQVKSWLTQVKAADDGSPDFRRAIGVLENLLRNILPETTVLLANYPNPFNPETWIPYQLSNASDVQITIYDTKGTVVRNLVLGHQAAGYYTDRNRAAYWDGRNDLGEPVASGVYFYQLQTDNNSHLRKMVILK